MHGEMKTVKMTWWWSSGCSGGEKTIQMWWWSGVLVVVMAKRKQYKCRGGSGGGRLGFGRLCSKKKHIVLLAVLIFFRNYAKSMLLSENYALCHRNYAT